MTKQKIALVCDWLTGVGGEPGDTSRLTRPTARCGAPWPGLGSMAAICVYGIIYRIWRYQ